MSVTQQFRAIPGSAKTRSFSENLQFHRHYLLFTNMYQGRVIQTYIAK